jgi:hypothetical protein
MVKTTNFLIQMVIFEFKLKTWTNQSVPPRSRLCVPAASDCAVDTDRPDSSAGGIDRSGWSVPVTPPS